MISVQGKYNTAKVFTDELEKGAEAQIQTFCNEEYLKDSQIRVMPDVHPGKCCTIGTTMVIKDAVCPNFVGVDIGCFTGDTLIPLSDGHSDIPISDTVDQDVWVYSVNENDQIVPAKARGVKTRVNASLVAVTLDNGEVIRCTPDHQFMLRDGTYREAKDLVSGTSLRPLSIWVNPDGHIFVGHAGGNQRNYPYHRFLMHYVLGEDVDGKVVHHKNGNPADNRLENLQIMEFSEHSKHHRDIESTHTFQTEEFKEKRIKKLQENHFYTEKYHDQRARIGTANFQTYMHDNPEHFAVVVAENARRFSKLASETNASYYEQSRRKLCYLYKIAVSILPDEITEQSWNAVRHNFYNCPYYNTAVARLNKFNMTWQDLLNKDCWRDKLTYNHKVVSVVNLDYTEDVYCLQVPDYHNFALSCGVFVHNCGILTVRLKDKRMNLPDLDSFIRKNIPYGFSVRKKPHRGHGRIDITELYCYNKIKRDKLLEGLASLGGGNHYLEVDKDESGYLYLTIHTGSRNAGKRVAEYYQDVAYSLHGGRTQEEVPYETAYLYGDTF